MRIAEIFYSLQGEGIRAGVPSVFIRTSGCNLRCAWCDTPYTSWEPEGEELKLEEILARLGPYQDVKDVVITGGEPMIAREIVPLTRLLSERGHEITVETAGTVFAPVVCHLMSISPKMSNSTPAGQWAAAHDRLRIQPGVLRRLVSSYPYQLKFVVASPEDVKEIPPLVEQIGASADRVLLMPEGTSPEVITERSRWLAELCKEHRYRLSPRLHIQLWGNRRGV